MGKLIIVYRTEDREDDYLKGKTYYSFLYEGKKTVISIAPGERRKLSEIVFGIEKILQDGFHLEKDERFDIDKEDKLIMEYEVEKKCRMDNKLYPYFRNIAQKAGALKCI